VGSIPPQVACSSVLQCHLSSEFKLLFHPHLVLSYLIIPSLIKVNLVA
jgi:hypothetical protein